MWTASVFAPKSNVTSGDAWLIPILFVLTSANNNPLSIFTSSENVAAAKVVGTMLAEPSKLTPPIVLAVVSVAAEPVVFWLRVPTVKSIVPSESSYATVIPDSVLELNIAPTVSCTTSDRSMFAVPSKLTPCIVLAVANAVAVAAKPVVSWFNVPITKSIVPSESS